jgi:GT2 family glycosyltransferase
MTPPSFSIVILSGAAENLVTCVRAIMRHEPALPPDRIIVVDDGAREEASPHLPAVRWVQGVRPFVFARNANLGLSAAEGDAILVNDDAELTTPRGFSALAAAVQREGTIGLCSPAIEGVVGNDRQRPGAEPPTEPGADQSMRGEPRYLCFVCVYVARAMFDTVGPLDERFVGYGWDDIDYSVRARRGGWRLGIFDGCIVEHGVRLPSAYRSKTEFSEIFEDNRKLFEAKHGRI